MGRRRRRRQWAVIYLHVYGMKVWYKEELAGAVVLAISRNKLYYYNAIPNAALNIETCLSV